VLLVNLLAALNFAAFFKIKNVWKIKNVIKHKKRSLHLWYTVLQFQSSQRETTLSDGLPCKLDSADTSLKIAVVDAAATE